MKISSTRRAARVNRSVIEVQDALPIIRGFLRCAARASRSPEEYADDSITWVLFEAEQRLDRIEKILGNLRSAARR